MSVLKLTCISLHNSSYKGCGTGFYNIHLNYTSILKWVGASLDPYSIHVNSNVIIILPSYGEDTTYYILKAEMESFTAKISDTNGWGRYSRLKIHIHIAHFTFLFKLPAHTRLLAIVIQSNLG